MGLTSPSQSYKNSDGAPSTGILASYTTLISIAVLGFSFFITPANTQERASDGVTVGNTRGSLEQIPTVGGRTNAPELQRPGETNDTCLLPPLSQLQSHVVAAKSLAVPAKAKKEYMAGCAALSAKKLDSAEKHLRKAVESYPEYPAAWTTLGQLLSAEKHNDEARDACSKASAVEPRYLPAYLCLAEIASQNEAWADVLQFSNKALQLDRTTTALAYLYNAAANLNLHRLDEAEQSALRALAIDDKNSDPREHFVLAQIYEAKGDRPKEIFELRAYLKFAKSPEDIAYVKQCLARLEKSGSVNADQQ